MRAVGELESERASKYLALAKKFPVLSNPNAKFPVLSLLAGNCHAETGSIVTASTTNGKPIEWFEKGAARFARQNEFHQRPRRYSSTQAGEALA